MMTDTASVIAKEIVIALIEKGHFDYVDEKSNHTAMQEARSTAIAESYKKIHKTIYESLGEEDSFWKS